MKLTDLIKALTDVLAEVGDIQTFVTTEKESKLYDAAYLCVVPRNKYLKRPFLRIEGADDIEEEKEEDLYE